MITAVVSGIPALKTPGKAYEPRVSEKTLVTDPLCKPESGTFLNQTHEPQKSQKIMSM